MKNINYLIKNINPKTDKNIRLTAKEKKSSITEIVKTILDREFKINLASEINNLTTIKQNIKRDINDLEESIKELDT